MSKGLDMKELQRVVKEANIVRKWAEDLIESGYYDFPYNLEGMCAIVSGELSKRLSIIGIPHEIALNDHHAFVLYNKYVVDISATQFGIDDPVWIAPLATARKNKSGWWKIVKRLPNAIQLVTYQHRVGWAEDQIAHI